MPVVCFLSKIYFILVVNLLSEEFCTLSTYGLYGVEAILIRPSKQPLPLPYARADPQQAIGKTRASELVVL